MSNVGKQWLYLPIRRGNHITRYRFPGRNRNSNYIDVTTLGWGGGGAVTVSPINTGSVKPRFLRFIQSRIIRYAEMIDLDSATTAVPVRATWPTHRQTLL